MISKIKDRLKRIDNDQGFTLVELLVAIAILALVVFPTMEVFLTATKTNGKAREELQATITANSVLEGAKAFSIYVYDRQCNGMTSDFSLMAGDSAGNAFTSTSYGGSAKAVTFEATNSKKITSLSQSNGFVVEAPQYAYILKGIRQSKNKYDAIIVFDKAESNKNVNVNGSSTFSTSDVQSTIGMSNKQYNITIYVYKNHTDDFYENRVIGDSDDEMLLSITGSKFDTASSPK